MKLWIAKKDDAICERCKNFYQHYIYLEGRYMRVHAGHCAVPRVKDREPYDTCKYYERKSHEKA